MSRKLKMASVLATALTFSFTLLSADGSGAAAQAHNPQITALPVAGAGAPDDLLPEVSPVPAAPQAAGDDVPPPVQASTEHLTLADFVAEQDTADASRELQCLAGAIYFEAKSETLEGQLAVGRVVVNRSRSGRFPGSYCGVVFQPSQFSFIRGKAMPSINRASRSWKDALAIAKIANDGSWTSEAEGALFFHAARVSPNWRLTRIARVDNHVFYR